MCHSSPTLRILSSVLQIPQKTVDGSELELAHDPLSYMNANGEPQCAAPARHEKVGSYELSKRMACETTAECGVLFGRSRSV